MSWAGQSQTGHKAVPKQLACAGSSSTTCCGCAKAGSVCALHSQDEPQKAPRGGIVSMRTPSRWPRPARACARTAAAGSRCAGRLRCTRTPASAPPAPGSSRAAPPAPAITCEGLWTRGMARCCVTTQSRAAWKTRLQGAEADEGTRSQHEGIAEAASLCHRHHQSAAKRYSAIRQTSASHNRLGCFYFSELI